MSDLDLGLPDPGTEPVEPDLFEAWARLRRQADQGRLFAHPDECKVEIADLRALLGYLDQRLTVDDGMVDRAFDALWGSGHRPTRKFVRVVLDAAIGGAGRGAS